MSRRAIDEHDGLGEFFDDGYCAAAGDYHRLAFSYGRRKIDEVLAAVLAELPRGSEVLDVGCGTGDQLRRCREAGMRVTGVEPAARLRQAALAANPEVEVVDALAGELPFPDRRFDLVISIEVLRYLEPDDLGRAYDELARVVRPGGRVVLTLVNRWATDGYWLYHRLRQAAGRWLGSGEPLHCGFTSPRQAARELGRRGFDEVRAVGVMAGKLRLLYKLGLGAVGSRLFEPVDDWLSRRAWAAPFAGHLVVIARRGDG